MHIANLHLVLTESYPDLANRSATKRKKTIHIPFYFIVQNHLFSTLVRPIVQCRRLCNMSCLLELNLVKGLLSFLDGRKHFATSILNCLMICITTYRTLTVDVLLEGMDQNVFVCHVDITVEVLLFYCFKTITRIQHNNLCIACTCNSTCDAQNVVLDSNFKEFQLQNCKKLYNVLTTDNFINLYS